MDRRLLIAAGLVAGAAPWTVARAQGSAPSPAGTEPPPGPVSSAPLPPASAPGDQPPPPASPPPQRAADTEGLPPPREGADYPASTPAETYSRGEIVNGVSDFLGVTAESAGAAIQRIFKDNGQPTAYIAGEEGSGAFIGGLRYGSGLLYMKKRQPTKVYWRGPSVGFDWGGNAARNFTLCYNLQYPEMIFRRFPGVEGTAYLIGGLGVNYQRAEGVTLAPIRAGLGLRLGANLGYLVYSRSKSWFPF